MSFLSCCVCGLPLVQVSHQASCQQLGYLSLRAADLVSAARNGRWAKLLAMCTKPHAGKIWQAFCCHVFSWTGSGTYPLQPIDEGKGMTAPKQTLNINLNWWPVHAAQDEDSLPRANVHSKNVEGVTCSCAGSLPGTSFRSLGAASCWQKFRSFYVFLERWRR